MFGMSFGKMIFHIGVVGLVVLLAVTISGNFGQPTDSELVMISVVMFGIGILAGRTWDG